MFLFHGDKLGLSEIEIILISISNLILIIGLIYVCVEFFAPEKVGRLFTDRISTVVVHQIFILMIIGKSEIGVLMFSVCVHYKYLMDGGDSSSKPTLLDICFIIITLCVGTALFVMQYGFSFGPIILVEPLDR